MFIRFVILIIIISYTQALTQIRSDFMISDSGQTPFFNFDNKGNIHLIYGNGYACYSALTESGETLFEKLKLGSSNYDAFTPTLDINGDLIACIWESRHKPPVVGSSTYIKSRILSNGQAINEEIKVNDEFGDAYRKNPVIIWHNDSTLFAVWAGNGSQSYTQNFDIYYKKLFLNPFRQAYTSDRIIDNSKLDQDEFRPSIIKKKYSEGYFIVRLEEDSLGYWNYTGISCNDSLVPIASKMVYKEKVTTPTSWMSKPVILQRPNGNYIVIWEEDVTDETANIYFREYSEDGVSLTQEIKANDSPAFAATEITASIDSSGNFIIVWEDGKNLQAQRFYSDLSKKGSAFQINSLGTGNNIYPHVRLYNGKIYTAWNKSSNSSSGFSVWMNILDFDNPVSVQIESTAPKEFILSQNYPNPFNPSTTIKYSIPQNVKREMSNVKLIVYDVLGREVATLVNEEQASGTYNYQFSIGNYQLSSGIYFYTLKAGSFSETKKMILLR